MTIVIGVVSVVLAVAITYERSASNSGSAFRKSSALTSGQNSAGECQDIGFKEFERGNLNGSVSLRNTINICPGSSVRGRMPYSTLSIIHKRRRNEPDANIYQGWYGCPRRAKMSELDKRYDVFACRRKTYNQDEISVWVSSRYKMVDRWPAGIRLEFLRK